MIHIIIFAFQNYHKMKTLTFCLLRSIKLCNYSNMNTGVFKKHMSSTVDLKVKCGYRTYDYQTDIHTQSHKDKVITIRLI